MAQHDFNIANQSFPSFRTDLNNALSAINTSQSGTSRPSGAVAGTIWLDTTSATTPTLKYYDGADDISLATLDHSANTVNWLDSTVSITGLSTTATGTVLTLTDSDTSSSVNLILQNQKEIRFSETTANGTNYVGFKAPASLSADKIWVLPSADGTAGQFLKTDGAGNLSFDSLSFSTPLAVIGNATSGSEIRLPEDTDNGSNYVALKAPDTIASNLTLTLPSADGTSGQVLQTNGSGVLSFAGVSGGKVLQVINSTQTSSDSISSNASLQDTSLSASITPSSTSNKILILASFSIGAVGDYFCFVGLKRASTIIGGSIRFSPNSGANLIQSGALTFLDTPSTTSATTYRIMAKADTTLYFNGREGSGSESFSTITLLEIAG
jgi:hypothetical protein